MSEIQSILFDKNKYDATKARKWLKRNKYKPIKRVHKTEKYLRYRIKQPNSKYQYRTISFGKDIKAVIQII